MPRFESQTNGLILEMRFYALPFDSGDFGGSEISVTIFDVASILVEKGVESMENLFESH